ncbi:WRKY transcription factor 19 [Phytophthora cinnamomi]|uniref:WRKY transcription factor 19 n=1 Tax=Phytophthora cinnamomi TaxID=4785 RepID=UPI00355A7E18|nr:WRKY transcription factor 19 [Phytophthora cinnamomi]
MLRAPVNTVDASWTGAAGRAPFVRAISKGSLGFIMNAADVCAVEPHWFGHHWEGGAAVGPLLSPSAASTEHQDVANTPTPTNESAKLNGKSRTKVRRELSYEEKRRSRECKMDGCVNYIINKGLCFRHGGGKKCSVQECRSSAKNSGLCWRHGGSVKCVVEGCERRGKSRGLCWTHGGGTKCSSALCTKVAVSNGCCWAHGGGKRCAYEGCKKAACERTHNFCVKHHDQLKDGRKVLHI